MLFLASAVTFDALVAAVPFALLLLAGLGLVLRGLADQPGTDFTRIFEAFLPPHQTGPNDPFGAAERILGSVAEYGARLSLVAAPAFLLFATRAFASVRTALNSIYDVTIRPVHQGFVLGILTAKLRDLAMVIGSLGLFLLSTALTTALALLTVRGEEAAPGLDFLVGPVGRFLAEAVAFAIILALFFLLYRFASTRRIRLRAAWVASIFAAVMFEIARRLFAFYVTNVAVLGGATIDASIGALLLFVLWVYYSALVFLFGGVIAETWELRHLLQRHRTVPA